MGVIAAIGVVLALAYWVHFIFEGERYVRDVCREWKLSRRTLAQQDARWQLAEKADVVVSLTTIPSRIEFVDTALKSLMDQARPPRKIVLNVPDFSLREDVAYEVPARLLKLTSVEVRRGRDWGPATKVIPTLLAAEADQLVVVVDDDRIYPHDFIQTFERRAEKTPDVALTMAGWIVPQDLIDRRTTIRSNFFKQPPAPLRGTRLRKPREIDVVLGVFGYAVRPRFYDLEALADFSDTPKFAFLTDDVRTSALCQVAKHSIPCRGLSCLPKADKQHFRTTALARLNKGDGRPEDRNNSKSIRYYAHLWRVGGPKAGRTDAKAAGI